MANIGWSNSALVGLLVAIFSCINAEVRIVEPTSLMIYVQLGGQFRIEAVTDVEQGGRVEMCHQKPSESTCTKLESQATANFMTMKENNQIVMRYTPTDVTQEMVGVYKVSQIDSNNQPVGEKSVKVSLIKIESVNGTLTSLTEEGVSVSVECRVSGLNVRYQITWMKDGQIVTQSERPVQDKNDTFTIEEPKPKDVGPYTCVVTPDGSSANLTAVAYIHSPPFVDEFGRGKNLVQGDMVVIDCHVYGYPLPEVTWTKDEEPLKPDNRTTISEFNGVPGAKLKIQDLNMEDRAEYGCVATNKFNSTTQVISIRVKDKYAALWPFLGICVEVIVLCAIIFLYERRRNKKNAEKEKSPEKVAAQNGKDDVRQRNKTAVKA